jgi:hypothetical protein
MKTNIAILVNVKGVMVADDVLSVTVRWLAEVLRVGMDAQLADIVSFPSAQSVECDENIGTITISEERAPR